jgi:hypothetical protein
VSRPRISVFASSANGNAAASRVIEGQDTLQARTSHEIAIDTIHDELGVPNPFAQALLFFRGGAKGNEPPVRVIQGPKTMLSYPDNVTLDAVNREAVTAQFRQDAIFIFRSDVGGDVAPIRIIHGPKTKLDRPIRVSVDPVHDLLAAVTATGLWIFDRTANGDVAPRWIIEGPHTGLGLDKRSRKPLLVPEGKKLLAGGSFMVEGKLRPFIGAWLYGDNGDVAPWAVLNATSTTKIIHGHSMAVIPEAQELLTVSGGHLFAFRVPELFQ